MRYISALLILKKINNMKKTFGGARIGSGNKMQFDTKTFNRSTQNLNKIFKSTMSAGTLVPFYVTPTLPGDTHDITLNAKIHTLPTVGPLFGSYKLQLDVYQVVQRQYNRDLQMNKLEVGKNIENIQFPLIEIESNNITVGLEQEYTKETPWGGKQIANSQIEPSSIFSYLGIRGLGQGARTQMLVKRRFNMTPWLAYWDIVKNYYANKQEEEAYYIHNELTKQNELVKSAKIITNDGDADITMGTPLTLTVYKQLAFILKFEFIEHFNQFQELEFYANITTTLGGNTVTNKLKGEKDFIIQRKYDSLEIYFTWRGYDEISNSTTVLIDSDIIYDYTRPNVKKYDLINIDTMRDMIMSKNGDTPLIIDNATEILAPYTSVLYGKTNIGGFYDITSLQCKQEGLALKTYQSDVNNNFLNTEWITGSNGVNEVTSIKVDEDGKFTLDEFNIKKKVYDMLNHIVASGGSYDDWQEIVYGVERVKQITSPMYEGGLSKEIVFEEVVSYSASNAQGEQALGTLAGRGVLNEKHKGGSLIVKCNEPGYIIGIVSITPRIDYSQGNKWFTNLKNMSELHNPYLDAIAYQDLITDTVGFWDTVLDIDGIPTYKSMGKQPSWINYQTDINEVYGNFALENEQMFMTLNRRYEVETDSEGTYKLGDATTYIDPNKYNYIFADTSPDAMNFWVQIAIQNECRRVMSANQIPNL